jgi:hypothetical protein
LGVDDAAAAVGRVASNASRSIEKPPIPEVESVELAAGTRARLTTPPGPGESLSMVNVMVDPSLDVIPAKCWPVQS